MELILVKIAKCTFGSKITFWAQKCILGCISDFFAPKCSLAKRVQSVHRLFRTAVVKTDVSKLLFFRKLRRNLVFVIFALSKTCFPLFQLFFANCIIKIIIFAFSTKPY